MKTLMLVFVTSFAYLACNKVNNDVVWDIGIDILVVDNEGNDLLDPMKSNYLDISRSKIYYLIDGKKIEQYDPNLDCPSKFCLLSELGRNSIVLTPNYTEKDEFPITVIEWAPEVVDTIKCQFVKYEGNLVCNKVWYNGIQKFPNEAIPGFQRAFKIIK